MTGVYKGVFGVKLGDNFSHIYITTYVVNHLLYCLVQAVLIKVHSICFPWDIGKINSVQNVSHTSLPPADTLVVCSGITVNAQISTYIKVTIS